MQTAYATDATIIVKFIRSERIKRYLTQADMANALDISQNAYSKIELGITKLTVENLLHIADLFAMQEKDLLNTEQLIYVMQRRGIEILNWD